MYMLVQHIHNIYMTDSQLKHVNSCTCHVHVMYMLNHHVHAINLLIISAFNTILPHHVHVCAKF